MSFESLLIGTCDIQHFTVTGADDYGRPTGTWDIAHDDEPCRHVSGKGREIKIGQEVVIIHDELFVGDVNISEQDRVIIDCTTYQVLSVVFRKDNIGFHHNHCYLELVK